MSIFHNNSLIGASGSGGGAYSISRSLRFNSADSAYLSRTPASAGNRKTWTWAGWIKRSNVTTAQVLFGTQGLSNDATTLYLAFVSNSLRLSGWNDPTAVYLFTSQVFRDPSAWFHVVLTVDTTQASAANRVKLYVNGLQISSFSTDQRSLITQNSDLPINSTQSHDIGRVGPAGLYADFYLADIHFCDGTAYDPSAFAEFDTNGIWQPKKFTGTYGTNGFKLDFADNSNNTATTLGKDTSGNGNNWTPFNLSVTAGAGNDSLVDVPTNGVQPDTGVGGEVRGNYCTANPFDNGGITLRNGNLDLILSPENDLTVRGTVGVTSGKWYWEITATDIVAGGGSGHKRSVIGIATINSALPSYVGSNASSWGYISHDGRKINNNTPSTYGGTWVTGDIIGVAFNADAGSLTFYKNNVSQGTAFTGLLSGPYLPAFSLATSGASEVINFGQRPFAYTAPSGFKALCTANLPAPVVTKPSSVFDVKLWTGNGSTQTITTGFSPDLVWVKQRDSTNSASHVVVDAVRGNNLVLRTNGTDQENSSGIDPSLYDGVTNLSSTGFDAVKGSSTVYNGTNGSGKTYVGWCWDAGSSTVTNTQGSITSSVRANASAGFSIVTYTGNNTAGATIGHGLGVTPSLIIVKSRGASTFGDWTTYHQSVGNTGALFLNLTQGVNTNVAFWNNTSPSSTVFTVRTDTTLNQNGINYVAYCFAPVAGYSAFGSYTGNGSTDGAFVYTGFRPRFILTKRTDSTGDWIIHDTARSVSNVAQNILFPNLSAQENSFGVFNIMDILSNGFKFRLTGDPNTSGGTFVYAAFAESPFSLARAR